MGTFIAREKTGLTTKITREIAILGGVGTLLFVAGIFWLIATDFETKLVAVPIALGGVGIGFAIFGLVASRKALNSFQPGQQVVETTPETITFAGLTPIKWEDVSFAFSVGKYEPELSVGFGLGGLGKGKQATLHSPVAKLFKQPAKHKVSSTYLLMVVENQAEDFGKNFSLGTVKPMPGEQTFHQVIISPDLFLDDKTWGAFIDSVAENVQARHNLYAHYYSASMLPVNVGGWAAYRMAGVRVNGNTITPGTKALYDWVTSLTDEQNIDLLQREQAYVSQPGYMEKRAEVMKTLTDAVAAKTGRDSHPDTLYSAGWALAQFDRILEKDKNVKLAQYSNAVSVLENSTIIALAEANGVEVSAETKQLFLQPLYDAGFTERTVSPQVPDVEPERSYVQQPSTPVASRKLPEPPKFPGRP